MSVANTHAASKATGIKPTGIKVREMRDISSEKNDGILKYDGAGYKTKKRRDRKSVV